MGAAAAQAEKAAAQAELAAGAFEAAFAATADPAQIAANRAQLMALIATNFLGLNTPAIMATEALYMEMWAQDAAAMYGYAAASAVASQLIPFSPPQQATNPTGLAAQFAAVMQAAGTAAGSQQTTLAQLLSAVPSALQGLASPASSTSGGGGILNALAVLDPLASGSANDTTGLNGLLNMVGGNTAIGQFLNANVWNTLLSSGSNTLGPFMSLATGGQQAASAAGDALGDAAASGLGNGLAGSLQSVGDLRGLGGTVSAGLGNAASIGPISVPPSWTAPAPTSGPLASSLGGTPMVGPPAAVAGGPGAPGMPIGTLAGRGWGRAVPQYGFRPTFVAHPPAAG
jgi:PPE-repeat protein